MKTILRLVTLAAGAVAVAALVALLAPGVTSANNGRVNDRRDARTPLDIASVSHSHSGTRIVHTVRTYKPFASKLLKGDNNAILFGFDVNNDSKAERVVGVVWAHGGLRGILMSEDGSVVERVPVSRPDSRSVRVVLSPSAVTNPPSYGWAAATLFQSKSVCRKGCVDVAPNRGFLRHRLFYLQSLDVSVNGDGSVSSDPSGIDCPAGDCSAEFKRGTTVTLTATPGENQTFTGWSGACTGTGDCTVKLSGDKSVTATFEPTYELTVSATGPGTVRLVPPDILCAEGNGCTQRYEQGTTVTLTAEPGVASSFAGWSGACTGIDPICTLTMDGDKSVSATFDPTPGP